MARMKPRRSMKKAKYSYKFATAILQLLLTIAQPTQANHQTADQDNTNKAAEQIHIPNRAPNPLFKGKQGQQKTEIHFDPAAGLVTLKLLVQDPNGYFIPNIRRDNFVVYENGVRQQNATADTGHAP